jgi:hypothetical protein
MMAPPRTRNPWRTEPMAGSKAVAAMANPHAATTRRRGVDHGRVRARSRSPAPTTTEAATITPCCVSWIHALMSATRFPSGLMAAALASAPTAMIHASAPWLARAETRSLSEAGCMPGSLFTERFVPGRCAHPDRLTKLPQRPHSAAMSPNRHPAADAIRRQPAGRPRRSPLPRRRRPAAEAMVRASSALRERAMSDALPPFLLPQH